MTNFPATMRRASREAVEAIVMYAVKYFFGR
jgi:hypothetical protein